VLIAPNEKFTGSVTGGRNAGFAAVALASIIFSGCYDGDALIQRARSTVKSTGLAEVDLGTFKTTLPRDPNTNRITEVDLHIFGTVQRYRASAVKKQVKTDGFRLRHETLAAVRKSTREEFAQPDFAQLRARIEKVVNEVLADSPVETVGFYQLTLRQP
jgi:hypothetical protein